MLVDTSTSVNHEMSPAMRGGAFDSPGSSGSSSSGSPKDPTKTPNQSPQLQPGTTTMPPRARDHGALTGTTGFSEGSPSSFGVTSTRQQPLPCQGLAELYSARKTTPPLAHLVGMSAAAAAGAGGSPARTPATTTKTVHSGSNQQHARALALGSTPPGATAHLVRAVAAATGESGPAFVAAQLKHAAIASTVSPPRSGVQVQSPTIAASGVSGASATDEVAPEESAATSRPLFPLITSPQTMVVIPPALLACAAACASAAVDGGTPARSPSPHGLVSLTGDATSQVVSSSAMTMLTGESIATVLSVDSAPRVFPAAPTSAMVRRTMQSHPCMMSNDDLAVLQMPLEQRADTPQPLLGSSIGVRPNGDEHMQDSGEGQALRDSSMTPHNVSISSLPPQAQFVAFNGSLSMLTAAAQRYGTALGPDGGGGGGGGGVTISTSATGATTETRRRSLTSGGDDIHFPGHDGRAANPIGHPEPRRSDNRPPPLSPSVTRDAAVRGFGDAELSTSSSSRRSVVRATGFVPASPMVGARSSPTRERTCSVHKDFRAPTPRSAVQTPFSDGGMSGLRGRRRGGSSASGAAVGGGGSASPNSAAAARSDDTLEREWRILRAELASALHEVRQAAAAVKSAEDASVITVRISPASFHALVANCRSRVTRAALAVASLPLFVCASTVSAISAMWKGSKRPAAPNRASDGSADATAAAAAAVTEVPELRSGVLSGTVSPHTSLNDTMAPSLTPPLDQIHNNSSLVHLHKVLPQIVKVDDDLSLRSGDTSQLEQAAGYSSPMLPSLTELRLEMPATLIVVLGLFGPRAVAATLAHQLKQRTLTFITVVLLLAKVAQRVRSAAPTSPFAQHIRDVKAR